MLSHQWQNIMHRVLGSQCGLCRFPISTEQNPNPMRWCDRCFEHFAPIKRCTRCGLTMTEEESQTSTECGECLKEPPPWQRLYTLGDYDFPLSNQVQRFKDHGEAWHVGALTQLLAKRIEHPAPVITCVPIHWQRYLKRGFNQSHFLAKHLAHHLDVRYEDKVFKRVKSVQSQRGNKKASREQNLKGAFTLQGEVNFSHVAIVDDVVTTGSTVRQLCHLLLEVGVESIDIYCICRTPAPSSL
ncbi:Pribosyltran domain-containing protein [Vibrio owensii]|uniref:Pribosyltran domain-containing protein n=1 Tax=Vibrio owensii TaxID=696485 RepID=A0AAU9QA22_9VIBR|nr:Pribosyltran domain-containing protein [Vibrio owensii]